MVYPEKYEGGGCLAKVSHRIVRLEKGGIGAS